MGDSNTTTGRTTVTAVTDVTAVAVYEIEIVQNEFALVQLRRCEVWGVRISACASDGWFG